MELTTTVVLLILILGMLALFSFRRASPSADFPYRKRTALFTPAERSFLGVLDQAARPTYRVLGKVRLADIIEVKGARDRSGRRSAFNRISSKHVDFVLCRPDDLSIVGAIELDDRSHQGKASRQRDQFVERACQVAGVPLLRFPAKQAYTVSQVRRQILEAVEYQPQPKGETPSRVEPVLGLDDERPSPTRHPGEAPTRGADVPPACPKCSSAMERKTIRQGGKAGESFWGCGAYPACRGIRPM